VSPESLPAWDFVVQDGRLPAYGQKTTPTQTALASGHFDYNWRYDAAFVAAGDAAARARANQIRRPRATDLPAPEVLDRYVGKYALPNGDLVEVRREGANLVAQAGSNAGEMLPQTTDNFFLPAFGVWIAFERNADGKVSGLKSVGGGSEFEAARKE
jgi:hypothetical protein